MNRKNYMENVRRHYPLFDGWIWADDENYLTFTIDFKLDRRHYNCIKRKHGIPQRYALMIVEQEDGKIRYQRFARKYDGDRLFVARIHETENYHYPKY